MATRSWYRVTVAGWDREGTSKSKEVINGIMIERSRLGKYEEGLEIYKQFNLIYIF